MSCSDPNLQQVPRDDSFRSCVKAPEGWVLVDADYAGMELRLAAAIAGDAEMIKAFQSGEDLHSVTAEAIEAQGKSLSPQTWPVFWQWCHWPAELRRCIWHHDVQR